jgi:hypothetical protein
MLTTTSKFVSKHGTNEGERQIYEREKERGKEWKYDRSRDISSSHGGEHEVQICLLGCTALMMEAARTSETSVDSYFTRQYIPEDKCER